HGGRHVQGSGDGGRSDGRQCNGAGNVPGTGGGGTVEATEDGVTLQVKGLLQGAYRANIGGLMADTLREQSLLPEDQPYGSYGYNGTETLSAVTLETTGNNAPVDWVLVELRDVNNPDTVISTQAAVIQRDGDVANADTNTTDLHFDVPEGEYFVTLAHRNHLDVTTSSAVSLTGADGTLIDFTNPDTVSGEEFTVVDGQAALWAGDANGDNSVTAFGPGNDANSLLSDILKADGNINGSFDYAAPGYLSSDLDLNGVTTYGSDNSDQTLLNNNTATVAENSSGAGNYVIKGTTQRA
ncbi:MAG: hypothetical protein KDI15_12035, partial [Thiothrix sp.]|nr:hypothetical protein [Thiothrix sp.]